jgi:PGF-CTERM protein
MVVGMVFLGAVLVLSAGTALADQEPNDDFGSAEQISPGTHAGDLTWQVDDYDYYKFSVKPSDYIKVDFKAASSNDDMYLVLVDFDQYEIFTLSSRNNVVFTDMYYTSNETDAATWYIYTWADTEYLNYEFTLSIGSQDDAASARDAAGSYGGAYEMELGSAQGGHLEDLDDYDYYRFWAGSGDIIKVTFKSMTTQDNLYVELHDWDQYNIFTLDSREGNVISDMYYTANETVENWWFVIVWLDTDPGDYEVTVTITHQNDAGSDDDVGGDYAEAHVIAAGTYMGHLEDEDDYDYYRFQAGEGDIIKVTFSSDATDDDQYLELENWDKYNVWTLESREGQDADDLYYTAQETQTIWWFLYIWLDLGPGGYEFTLSIDHQDDAGTGTDIIGDCGLAHELADGTFDGQLGDLDEMDAYKVAVMEGWTLYVNLTNGQSAECTVGIIGDCGLGTTIGTLTSKLFTTDRGSWAVPEGTAQGSFWALLVEFDVGWEPGSYSLDIFVEKPVDNEAPGLVVTDPTEANEGEDLVITTTANDNVGVLSVKLYFTIDDDIVYNEVEMTLVGTEYKAIIPGTALAGATLKWYIVAKDAAGNEGTYGMEAAPKMLQITPMDTVPPTINFTPPEKAEKGSSLALRMVVEDDAGVQTVTIFFKIDDEVQWQQLAMALEAGNWTGTISGDVIEGKTLFYYVVAEDVNGLQTFYGNATTPKSMTVTKPEEDDGPGFGFVLAVAAIGAAMVVAIRFKR